MTIRQTVIGILGSSIAPLLLLAYLHSVPQAIAPDLEVESVGTHWSLHEGILWTLYLDDSRRVVIFPDGSVELPADLPVDETAWQFWRALGDTWPEYRRQICAPALEAER